MMMASLLFVWLCDASLFEKKRKKGRERKNIKMKQKKKMFFFILHLTFHLIDKERGLKRNKHKKSTTRLVWERERERKREREREKN